MSSSRINHENDYMPEFTNNRQVILTEKFLQQEDRIVEKKVTYKQRLNETALTDVEKRLIASYIKGIHRKCNEYREKFNTAMAFDDFETTERMLKDELHGCKGHFQLIRHYH